MIFDDALYFWSDSGWILLEEVEDYVKDTYPFGHENIVGTLIDLTKNLHEKYEDLKDECEKITSQLQSYHRLGTEEFLRNLKQAFDTKTSFSQESKVQTFFLKTP